MALLRWYKRDLELLDKDGYMIIPCEDENHAYNVKNRLRQEKQCAQAGKIKNKEGKEIFFVCTRERKDK